MSRTLAITLTLSAAAHLAAVGLGPSSARPEPAGSTVLALTLIPPATPRATPPPLDATADKQPVPQPHVEHRVAMHTPTPAPSTSTHNVVTRQPAAAVASADNSRSTSTVATTDTAAPTTTEDISSDALMQQIQSLLSGRFHYPRLARKRGWEGVVEIALNLAPDGRITQVQLHRASGHAVLDDAALDSANRLRAVPNAAALLQGRAREMIIPVHYRLRES